MRHRHHGKYDGQRQHKIEPGEERYFGTRLRLGGVVAGAHAQRANRARIRAPNSPIPPPPQDLALADNLESQTRAEDLALCSPE